MKNISKNGDRSLLKKMGAFCFLCCLVYFSSYITRKSFNASILAIINDASSGITKPDTGLAVTGNFIAYGVGQIINGILGDRISPKYMIPAGLVGAAICNILVPYSLTPVALCILMSFNGFFQSMIWPPLVKSMSENFTLEYYKKATTLVSIACCLATIAVYFLVILFVEIASWEYTFYFCTVIGILSAILWYFVYKRYEKNPIVDRISDSSVAPEPTDNTPRMPLWRVIVISSAIPIAVVVALHGFLRDGIDTWLPTFMSDEYGIKTSGALLTTAILPVLSMLSYSVGSFFQRKTGCAFKSNTVLWVFATVFSLILLIFYKSSMIVGVVSFMVLSASAHAMNLMLTTRIVIHYKKVGYVSTFSGLLNSFTYIGAAVASYGISNISWDVAMPLFLGVSVAGLVFSLIALPKWIKFTKE